MPINCTTIRSSNIIFKCTVFKCVICTISTSFYTTQEYSSTMVFCIVICKDTIFNTTVRTCPHNSSSVTRVTHYTYFGSVSTIIGEIGIFYDTFITKPEYCTCISACGVICKCTINHLTISTTFVPVNSTTIY